ncbi:efflux RND transporter periplasmic adaptor subunit [Chitinophaga vietnamensis]|uniref:efflux RND transporter periplasmic adaptor subunit n=1 Tax=Chitinophaga vietnamensis TaxID=2593957 RepID=UPI001375FD37|nr:efflux RND transporter periplasmic adaptor subunit [Chitinophaga vietnamensis]
MRTMNRRHLFIRSDKYASPFVLLTLLLFATLIWSSCKHPKFEDTEDSTFVLSDTMLKNIRIDTARRLAIQHEQRFSGKVQDNKTQTWVTVDAAVKDVNWIRQVADADITTASYPGKLFHGHIEKIYDSADTAKITQVRISIDNRHMLLKPAMAVTAAVKYKSNDEKIAVPSGAVISDNSKNYVLVFKNAFNVALRQVEVSQTAGDTTYLDSGLQSDEKVISKNQLPIYDALKD